MIAILLMVAGSCVFGLYLNIKGVACLRRKKLKSGLAYLFVGIPIFLVFAAMFIPTIAGHPGSRKRAPCLSNLNSIFKAYVMYSMDHKEAFPTSFTQLTNVLQNPKTFICPCSGHKPGPLALVDEWTDYVLITNMSAELSTKSILAYCKPENHKNRGCNVVLLNGAGLWIDVEEFTNLTFNVKAHSRINKRQPKSGIHRPADGSPKPSM
jgi:hypothetical protein